MQFLSAQHNFKRFLYKFLQFHVDTFTLPENLDIHVYGDLHIYKSV